MWILVPQLGIEPIPCLTRWILNCWTTWEGPRNPFYKEQNSATEKKKKKKYSMPLRRKSSLYKVRKLWACCRNVSKNVRNETEVNPWAKSKSHCWPGILPSFKCNWNLKTIYVWGKQGRGTMTLCLYLMTFYMLKEEAGRYMLPSLIYFPTDVMLG